jgi:hypothetical protein
MLRFLFTHRKLAALSSFVIVLFGWWAWDASAHIRGQFAARNDISRGHYRILAAGTPAPERAVYVRLMRERYGVEVRIVAGCVVSESLFAYTQGYNAVSREAVERRFGKDVFEATLAEAIKVSQDVPVNSR